MSCFLPTSRESLSGCLPLTPSAPATMTSLLFLKYAQPASTPGPLHSPFRLSQTPFPVILAAGRLPPPRSLTTPSNAGAPLPHPPPCFILLRCPCCPLILHRLLVSLFTVTLPHKSRDVQLFPVILSWSSIMASNERKNDFNLSPHAAPCTSCICSPVVSLIFDMRELTLIPAPSVVA